MRPAIAIALGMILGAFVLGAFVMEMALVAQAANAYPSVTQLQAALQAIPGTRLPPQVPQIIANGHVWTGYYVGTKDNGRGLYTVTIQLRRDK